MKLKIVLAGVAAAALLPALAHAATNVYPTVVGSSSSYPGYPAADAVDGVALTDWASYGDGNNAFLILDFGAPVKLTAAYVTDRVTSGGGNGAFAGGLYDFTTEFSLTPCSDALCTVTGAPIDVFHTAPAVHTSPADFLKAVSLPGFTTQYLEYNVITHDAPLNTNNTGLSDIHFTTAVPEPATWAMLLMGFFGLGAMVRASRRRTAVATA